LRIAVLALFWLTTAASVAVTVAIFSRRRVWQNRRDDALLAADELNDADVPVIVAVFLLTMLGVTSAIAIALWTLRLVNSARARRVPGLSPGWAAGGWFVPIGSIVLGFRQVSKAVAGVGGSTARVLAWQVSFAVLAAVMTLAQVTSEDVDSLADPQDTMPALNREWILSLAGSIMFVVTAALATRALIHADRSVEAVSPS